LKGGKFPKEVVEILKYRGQQQQQQQQQQNKT
jgi:hypothetical protein